MPKRYQPFYDGHDNPHQISFTTFRHRVMTLQRTYEQAMRVPYLGRGGDRKTRRFRRMIKQLRFIDPDATITFIREEKDF